MFLYCLTHLLNIFLIDFNRQQRLFLVHSMDVSPVASLIAVGTALGRVILLDLTTLKSENVIEPQKGFGPVRVVRFNKNGQLLVTGHDTGAIEVKTKGTLKD